MDSTTRGHHLFTAAKHWGKGSLPEPSAWKANQLIPMPQPWKAILIPRQRPSVAILCVGPTLAVHELPASFLLNASLSTYNKLYKLTLLLLPVKFMLWVHKDKGPRHLRWESLHFSQGPHIPRLSPKHTHITPHQYKCKTFLNFRKAGQASRRQSI